MNTEIPNPLLQRKHLLKRLSKINFKVLQCLNKLDDEDKSNEIKKLLTVMEKILTILLNITYVNKDSKGTKRRKGLRESGAFYRRS